MSKPTYGQLLEALCEYSKILHSLEEKGIDLESFDKTWQHLTKLEQKGREE